MGTSLKLEKINPAQVHTLAKLARQTFADAFGWENNPSDMHLYMEKAFSVPQMESELGDPRSTFYWILINLNPMGYFKLREKTAKGLEGYQVLELERIYVVKDHHGAGLASQLMQKAVDIGQKKGFDYIWLGVADTNHRALAFYRKWGFIEFDTHIFQLGQDPQTDLLLKKKL